MNEKYRQPTIEEAVEIICRPSNLRDTRFQHIAYWRKKYGNEYADEVQRKAVAILKKRKTNKDEN